MKETVEEYLARGGRINVIPTGVGKDSKIKVRMDKRDGRLVYVDEPSRSRVEPNIKGGSR